jgi:septal ring factor EnvC (AmiA/AmiB activator)
MFAQAKLIAICVVVVVIMATYAYVRSLQADLAVSEANNAALSTAVEQQRETIQQIQRDVRESQRISRELNAAIRLQTRDVETLRDKLQANTDVDGNRVTIGGLASKKTSLIEKKINQGTGNAYRCMEIASGAPLTEQEKNATKKSEINPECPSIANPLYQP